MLRFVIMGHSFKSSPQWGILNPSLDIYTAENAGQNWQILLPLMYNHKCLTVDEYLFNYVQRVASHSHSTKDFDCLIEKWNLYENVIERKIIFWHIFMMWQLTS